jgi:glycosyltransferase involved in cell wall biosynthesis
LSTADVCVNPDPVNPMNDKSTMNKIMEYMALGKPIVQFEMMEGRYSAQDAAIYAKPNDERDFAHKIVDLLADERARERMGTLGRQRVTEHLAWHHQVPTLLAAYDRALAK